jgi:UDP-N-acetylmuramate: L-alanyl-gamma-D-glutamyl-meso-diaminopimelate ligase
MNVHFIAIGGSAMHNLAIALKQKGYQVSGSDDEIFEPSKGRLQKHALLPKSIGWNKQNIHKNLDAVILGMHARADNPELAEAKALGITIYSYPEFLYEQSKDKTRVVIAGSHGKTSITAMILHALHYHQKDCDFMVGAQLEGFETMVRLTNENDFMLLEGDEYLSSPIDMRPKFLHYKPNIALLSGIAWDHINVFPTFEDYRKQFDLLLDSIEPGGALVYNELDEEVKRTVERTANPIKKFAYGLPNYFLQKNQVFLETEEGAVPLAIFGKHNMNNLEGARWICNQMGLTDAEFYEAIPSFTGAAKRLEKINDVPYTAFRDFAHAPSKVKATVNATKEGFADAPLLACLELHTYSSLNKDFIKQYKQSMQAANTAIVYFNPDVLKHKQMPKLSEAEVKEAFAKPDLLVCTNTQDFLKKIQENISVESVLLLMSSGNFNGIDWQSELNS